MTSGPRVQALRIDEVAEEDAVAWGALIECELPSFRGGAGSWSQTIAHEQIMALVALRMGRIVGAFLGQGAVDRLEVHAVAVAKDNRRRGVATRLIIEALARARCAGFTGVDLEVGARNLGAQAFYTRHAFVAVGRRPRYYRGVEDALLLSHEFAALER